MRRLFTNLRRCLRCDAGSMAIETAIIAPVLIALSIGGFEIGSIVARQTELQSAAAEAAAIVRASIPDTSEKRVAIRNVVAASTELQTWQVSVVRIYRCAAETSYVTTAEECDSGQVVNKFIRLTIWDYYEPIWAQFGVGSSLTFNVTRTVQIG
jgi:Flp pilus assembly protein TadG